MINPHHQVTVMLPFEFCALQLKKEKKNHRGDAKMILTSLLHWISLVVLALPPFSESKQHLYLIFSTLHSVSCFCKITITSTFKESSFMYNLLWEGLIPVLHLFPRCPVNLMLYSTLLQKQVITNDTACILGQLNQPQGNNMHMYLAKEPRNE